MEVVVRSPIIDRKRIPMAKVRFKLENGTRMTIIDWEIAHGLILLLLGFFIRATTCGDWDVYRGLKSDQQINFFDNQTYQTYDADKMLHSGTFCTKPKVPPTTIYVSIILPRTKSWLQLKLRQELQMVIFQHQLFHLRHRNRW